MTPRDRADDSLLYWLPLIPLQTDRMQKAAAIAGASRYATPELVASAGIANSSCVARPGRIRAVLTAPEAANAI
jgi:hypothetical protein